MLRYYPALATEPLRRQAAMDFIFNPGDGRLLFVVHLAEHTKRDDDGGRIIF